MSVPFGRVVDLVKAKAATRPEFSIGLEALEPETGQLVAEPVTDYEGAGVGFEAGDLLFGKLRPYLAKAWLADRAGAAVGDFHVYRPREGAWPAYLRWVLLSRDFLDPVVSSVFGAKMPRADWEFIRTVGIHLPEVAEQRAIADYLDRETARIDTLIEEQQGLIEMLRERRTALVDSTLSEGLDMGEGMRATGNTWLPRLPASWRVTRSKHVLSYGPQNGVSPAPGGSDATRSLSLGAIRDGRVRMDLDVTKFVDGSAISDLEDYRLHPGDILLVRGNGNVDLVARAGLVGPEFGAQRYIYPDLLIRVRMNSFMLPEFFVWACNASATRAQVRANANTAVGTFKVAGDDVRSLALPLPSLKTQMAIVAHLDEQTAKIDQLTAETERFIELSRERRTALITAAVTGQIDVREAA